VESNNESFFIAFYFMLLCMSLTLNRFYNVIVSDNKYILNVLFQIHPDIQSASLSYSGLRLPRRTQTQTIISPGNSEELKSAATYRSLDNWCYASCCLGYPGAVRGQHF